MIVNEGELIGVPCTVQLGPFPDERLVTVETDEGPISGFAKEENLQVSASQSEPGYIKAVVVKVLEDAIMVRLFGSFFTTALGVASVARRGVTRMAGHP